MIKYLFIINLRIIFAPLILVWPTPAIILSFFLDMIDAEFAYYIVTKKQYQLIDKTIDSWVFLFEMILAWQMFINYRSFLLILFLWRMIGTFFFYLTKKRHLLFVFGNFFENIFFVIYFTSIIPGWNLLFNNKPAFYSLLIFVSLIKLFQEWFIHIAGLSIREDIFGKKRKWRKTI